MVPKGIEGNYVILTKHFHFITTLPSYWYPCVPGGFFVLHRLEGRQ